MKEIFSHLYVGRADDIPKAKIKDFAVVSAFKDGEHGHRDLLGYKERSAPEGKEYYFAERSKHLYLNLIDADSADYIPSAVIDKALAFISENIRLGRNVLVACNQAESRAPSLAFLWLYLEGKLPADYHRALRTFRTLYPAYSPANGIRQYVKDRISAAKHRR
jgi:protein-tyrosine phosphatase